MFVEQIACNMAGGCGIMPGSQEQADIQEETVASLVGQLVNRRSGPINLDPGTDIPSIGLSRESLLAFSFFVPSDGNMKATT